MKKYAFYIVLGLLVAGCGENPADETTTTTTTTSADTAVDPATYGSMKISGASPSEANGLLTITSITQEPSDAYIAGQKVTIIGTNGDYTHKIEIVFTTIFTDGIEYATFKNISDAWGFHIETPEAISSSSAGIVTHVNINPELRSIVLVDADLLASSDFSQLDGTIYY